jgi:hypothetical protein
MPKMILTKKQMKALIKEEAFKIRANMKLESDRTKRISDIEKRKAEIELMLEEIKGGQ